MHIRTQRCVHLGSKECSCCCYCSWARDMHSFWFIPISIKWFAFVSFRSSFVQTCFCSVRFLVWFFFVVIIFVLFMQWKWRKVFLVLIVNRKEFIWIYLKITKEFLIPCTECIVNGLSGNGTLEITWISICCSLSCSSSIVHSNGFGIFKKNLLLL